LGTNINNREEEEGGTLEDIGDKVVKTIEGIVKFYSFDLV
jgi:hypothetical protein